MVAEADFAMFGPIEHSRLPIHAAAFADDLIPGAEDL